MNYYIDKKPFILCVLAAINDDVSLFMNYQINIIDNQHYNILDSKNRVVAKMKGDIKEKIAPLPRGMLDDIYIYIQDQNDDSYAIKIAKIHVTKENPADKKTSPEIKGSLPFYQNPLFKGAVVCICVASIIAGIMHQFNYSSAEFTQYMNKILSGRFAR